MSQIEFEETCKRYMDVVMKEKSETCANFGIDHSVEKKIRRCLNNLIYEKEDLMRRTIREP